MKERSLNAQVTCLRMFVWFWSWSCWFPHSFPLVLESISDLRVKKNYCVIKKTILPFWLQGYFKEADVPKIKWNRQVAQWVQMNGTDKRTTKWFYKPRFFLLFEVRYPKTITVFLSNRVKILFVCRNNYNNAVKHSQIIIVNAGH